MQKNIITNRCEFNIKKYNLKSINIYNNKINIEMEEHSMRETARGLLVIKNGLVLIHRIKQKMELGKNTMLFLVEE